MGDKSKIEWCDATWNPIRARNKATGGVGHFCEKLSAGCKHCYAERMQPRFKNPIAYGPQSLGQVEMYLDEEVLLQPLRWKRARMIFVGSMTDLFGHWVPDAWLDRIWAVMALCPQHTFQVVTKRPERMAEYLNKVQDCADPLSRKDSIECSSVEFDDHRVPFNMTGHIKQWPLPNVWLLTSVEDQATADARIPHLLRCPAVVRGLSVEPLLGPVDLRSVFEYNHIYEHGPNGRKRVFTDGRDRSPIDWVIAGGESGPKARPMHPEWVRRLRDQCAQAGVAFFFKQWGEWAPGGFTKNRPKPYRSFGKWETWGFVEGTISFRDDNIMYLVGKRIAGRLLDGVEHNGMPQVNTQRVH